MKRLKILSFIIVFAIIISSCSFFCSAKAKTVSSECDISDIDIPIKAETVNAAIGTTLDIKAKSVILMEPYTNKILYDNNSDEPLPPASITKIMSLLLIMEAIDKGTLTLDQTITASEHACSMGGSQIWLKPGENMSVDHLLKATVIASANDATVALGEEIAGSEEGFVAMMNEKAALLGMTGTTFINCTGLDAEKHITTAHDVAIMASELIKYPLIKKYSTVWMDTIRDGKSELVNTNKLVRFYKGTTGLKTGTTSGAGYCLAATANRDSMELVAVVMGAESSNDRFAGAKKLLDYGFANYSYTEIDCALESTFIPVTKGIKQNVRVNTDNNFKLLIKKSDAESIKKEVNLKEKAEAPIKKGDKIGSVDIYVKGEQVGCVDIKALESIPKYTLKYSVIKMIKGLFIL